MAELKGAHAMISGKRLMSDSDCEDKSPYPVKPQSGPTVELV